MPYFHNDIINLLLIHIPKTGGTSLEKYFSTKYNIPLNCKSLALCYDKKISTSSKQHYPFLLITTHKHTLGIKDDNLRILSCVRNPYTRIISDLLFLKIITDYTQQNVVELKIKEYLQSYKKNNETYDNHVKPQYLYLMKDGSINNDITIMRQESLTSDMHALGFTDFNTFNNVHRRKTNYYNFLSFVSVLLINNFYAKDFELFNYDMIQTEEQLSALQGRRPSAPSPPSAPSLFSELSQFSAPSPPSAPSSHSPSKFRSGVLTRMFKK